MELDNPALKQQINFIGILRDDWATIFFITEKSEKKNFWIYTKFCKYHIKWKLKNYKLGNDSNNEESKFATKKWYVIDNQATKGKSKQGDTIKFETETIKSSLCDW